jgi:CheY-like chemotaxis protein
LELRFPLALAAVETDANQLELALLNLVVNARDAMPNGGTIIIAARDFEVLAKSASDLPPGRYVRLSVTDSGEGMDALTLARATEPFFTTKGVGKGTGLGLPMVYGVAAQSGGRLVLKSELGRGTTAEIWLPCSTKTIEKSEEPEAPKPTSVRPLVVLLVDDDSLVLDSATAMLEDLGHRVLAAATANEALRLAGEFANIDLVISDHAMPKVTGAQLAQTLRTRFPNLPIIIATGYTELPDDIPIGVTRLSKPFSQHELEVAVSVAVRDTDHV